MAEVDMGIPSLEVVFQTKTIPTEQAVRERGPDWLEATVEKTTALLQTKRALRETTQRDEDDMVALGTKGLRVQ